MRLGWKIKVGSFIFVLRNAADSREIEVFGISRTKILLSVTWRSLLIFSSFINCFLSYKLVNFEVVWNNDSQPPPIRISNLTYIQRPIAHVANVNNFSKQCSWPKDLHKDPSFVRLRIVQDKGYAYIKLKQDRDCLTVSTSITNNEHSREACR